MEIKGQTAIVTGGASGLGAATAELFAKAGAKVAILDLNLGLAEQTAAKIGGIAVKCDVTSEQSAIDALAEVEKKIGIGRVLMNCAGTSAYPVSSAATA